MFKWGWIFVLLVLFGCIKPDYRPQLLPVPNDWRFEADESNTLCNIRWWEQFDDPVLNELIIIALNNNQDIQLAIARVFEFYAQLGITNAALFPTLTGNLSALRSESTLLIPGALPSSFRYFNEFQAYFALTWQLDLWGQLLNATEAAYYELLSTIQARRGVVLTIVSEVAKSYITLRQLDWQLEISRQTSKSRQDSLKLAVSRYQLGETSLLEVIQAEAELEIALIRVIEFERDIPIQENQLSILLGLAPQDIDRGRPLDSFYRPLAIPTGLPQDLLSQRPDVLGAEDRLIAANAFVASQRALFFPAINVMGQYGNESEQLSKLFTSPAQTWFIAVNAVQTLFDAGRIGFIVEVAEAQRDEALAQYRQSVLVALQEVNSAIISVQKNEELVFENKRNVRILSEYLHLAQLRYSEGEIDYLNVLDAERTLFDAQLQLAQAQADSFTAIVSLYSALGGGWVVDADHIATTHVVGDNEAISDEQN